MRPGRHLASLPSRPYRHSNKIFADSQNFFAVSKVQPQNKPDPGYESDVAAF